MLFRREPQVRNDDPEHDAQRAGPLKRWFRWFVLGLAALLLATLGVWVLTGPPPGPAPVIEGPKLPDRRDPGDQSALVPNQDQPIYQNVAPGSETDRGEDLLALPEPPMDRDAVTAQAEAQDRARQPGSPPAIAAPPNAAPSAAPASPTPPPTAAPPPPAPSTSPPAATAPPPPSQQYRIQIASVRTEDQAEAEWKRVAGRYPELLGRLTPYYERFETNNSGVYYRVQGGPLIDEALAELLCAQLKARKVPCLVIAP